MEPVVRVSGESSGVHCKKCVTSRFCTVRTVCSLFVIILKQLHKLILQTIRNRILAGAVEVLYSFVDIKRLLKMSSV